MPKEISQNSPARKKKKVAKSTQPTILQNFETKLLDESHMVNKDVLLTDAIFGKATPKEMKGYLFHYMVGMYKSTPTVTFSLTYCNRMIKDDGDTWEHQDGNRETMSGVTYITVKEGVQLYNTKLIEIKNNNSKKLDMTKAILKEKRKST